MAEGAVVFRLRKTYRGAAVVQVRSDLGAVSSSTVEWEKLLEDLVPLENTRIRIWVNHPIEPDKVTIGWG
jgi:hypothetical protein